MPPPKSRKSFEVAIVGGGVCGLTCALALVKEGVPVTVYEAAAAFGEIGAGIGIGVNALRVLGDIGVLKDVVSKSEDKTLNLRAFVFRSGMGSHETIYDYPPRPDDLGLGMHRASFLEALVQNMDPKLTKFNKRCIRVSPSPTSPSRSRIYFEDGTSAEADVVLGADGIKSAVRSAVVGDQAAKHVAFSNTIVYRGLVPIEQGRSAGVSMSLWERPVCYVGDGKHLIVFPIKGGTVVNVVAFVTDRSVEIGEANLPPGQPWVTPVSQSEMLAEYVGWGPDVTRLLECIREPNKWSIHVIYPPFKSYVKGQVALLGDAAHGMLPHLGAGAGQGLEDAHLLAKLLGHPQTNASNIEKVLQVYDKVRRPRTQKVWEDSRAAGDTYEGYGKHGLSPDGLSADLSGLWDYVWHHELHADFKAALSQLYEDGAFSQSRRSSLFKL